METKLDQNGKKVPSDYEKSLAKSVETEQPGSSSA